LGSFRDLPREMKIKSVRLGLALCGGWFAILVIAAIILPPIDSRTILGNAVPFLVLTAVWLLLTIVALATYFYRAWRRIPIVSNKKTYVAWLTFETACVLALACGLVWLFVPSYVTSPRRAREWALRQDLRMMNAVITQYTLDKQLPPHSLDDLVVAGYLKKVPNDPMTGRKDTWVVRCSSNLSRRGIVGIDSGYENISHKGTLRCD
jgi:general secretion pathway protein G